MTTEEKLKEYILTKYKSIREFVLAADIPYSTVDTILKRGVMNASIGNILKICSALNISADELADGKIVPVKKESEAEDIGDIFLEFKRRKPKEFELDNEPLTSEELSLLSDSLEISIEMVRRRRARNKLLETYSEGFSELLARHIREAKGGLYEKGRDEKNNQREFDIFTKDSPFDAIETRGNG